MHYRFTLPVALMVFTASVGIPALVRAQAQAPAPAVQAQDHDHDHATADAKQATAADPHQGMMMTNMMADMKASDAKLNALVQAMNAAKGAEKTDAIAALLTALVKEHSAMHSHMMGMMDMPGMMNNMPGMPGTSDKPKP